MSAAPEEQTGENPRQPTVETGRSAWQPLTPKGVAAFAGASLGRLLGVQFLVALLAAGTAVWFLHSAWFPVVTRAIGQMPDQGEIRAGKLDWRGESPRLLAESRFLALAVDLRHEGHARSPAHLEVEFGRNDFNVFSLFGFVARAYPRNYVLAFNRTDLGPWWGAWAPVFLAFTAGLVLGGLMLSWAILATAYCLPAWLVALYANRQLDMPGSWRLAGAALMPGALLLTLAILAYGLRAFDVVHLASAAALHFAVSWVYVALSPFHLPRHPAAAGTTNPFAGSRNAPKS
jgi:hypothetical protein